VFRRASRLNLGLGFWARPSIPDLALHERIAPFQEVTGCRSLTADPHLPLPTEFPSQRAISLSVYLGSISYGIYLYHAFVPALVDLLESQFALSLPFPADGGGKRYLAVTAMTLPIAALSWHFFEKPLNQLKSRFPYLRREPYSIRTIEIRPEVASQAAA